VTVRGVDHIQLAIPAGGEVDAERFWCGVLGFRRLPKPAPLAARGGAWFAAGDVQVHVGVEDPHVPARKAHPAFVVDDLDAVAARLAAAGHPVRWSDEIPETRRFHTDDPFGNRIELIELRG
jgi:predicted enzyme related to lactoylglutathione lyase